MPRAANGVARAVSVELLPEAGPNVKFPCEAAYEKVRDQNRNQKLPHRRESRFSR